MKNVLVMVHDDEGQEARLQAALDVARAIDGHIMCVDVTPLITDLDGVMGITGTMVLTEQVRQLEAANRQVIEARMRREDVPFDWVDSCDFPADALIDRAALADIIVISRHLANGPRDRFGDLTSQLVLRTNKPVLSVPDEMRAIDFAGAALVAWDGSTAAADALIQAVPLLSLASRVTIFEGEGHAEGTPADEAATYLSRHGIGVAIVRQELGKENVSGTLRALCLGGEYSYIVMGGYGHSRIRETLFGGVTRSMLKDCEIPLLLAH